MEKQALRALHLQRDDNGWRFILSNTGVTTAREARERRAEYPEYNWEPDAIVYFSTGECVMTSTPPKAPKCRVKVDWSNGVLGDWRLYYEYTNSVGRPIVAHSTDTPRDRREMGFPVGTGY